jgi:DNA-binding NarL/FixJ family response regulator
MSRPRVLLADDHTMLLEALEKLIAESCTVVGAVSNGYEVLEAAAQLRPDVVVLDIGMPLLNGIDAARQIKQLRADIRIIFLTMNEDPALAAEAFRAGALGYLLKRSAASELVIAIHEAMNHRSYVTPHVAAGLVRLMMDGQTGKRRDGELSPRQRQVLQLIAEGRSMKEVASVMNITARTVAFHKYRIMGQLHITSTAELIQYAIRHHIV